MNKLRHWATKNFDVIRLFIAVVIGILLAVAVIFAISEEPGNAIGKLLLGPLQNKRRFGNVKTLTMTLPPSIDPKQIKPLSNEVEVIIEEDKVILRFDPERVKLEEVIQYAFSQYHAIDMRIADISIEDVVKKILAQQEGERHAKKV